MTEWISVKTTLPKEDQECWVCTKDKKVCWGIFEEKKIRYKWVESEFVHTPEPAFRLDDEYCKYFYLDEATHWMPYFTPEPPND